MESSNFVLKPNYGNATEATMSSKTDLFEKGRRLVTEVPLYSESLACNRFALCFEYSMPTSWALSTTQSLINGALPRTMPSLHCQDSHFQCCRLLLTDVTTWPVFSAQQVLWIRQVFITRPNTHSSLSYEWILLYVFIYKSGQYTLYMRVHACNKIRPSHLHSLPYILS